jgi:hypothetical protein
MIILHGSQHVSSGALMFASDVGEARAEQAAAGPTPPVVTSASQGWSDADRYTFYSTSQGSHMMPYVWFKALRRLDIDEPFAAGAEGSWPHTLVGGLHHQYVLNLSFRCTKQVLDLAASSPRAISAATISQRGPACGMR